MIRTEVKRFQDIPNVGPAIEKDLMLIGLKQPVDLADKDPYQMFEALCNITQQRHDPCVIDVFIAAVDYMNGGAAKKWWEFTQQRKEKMSSEYA